MDQAGSNQIKPDHWLGLWLALPMNLDEKAPSPQPSPAEREREKGRQREGHAAKFMGSMRENPFWGNLFYSRLALDQFRRLFRQRVGDDPIAPIRADVAAF